MYFWTSQPGGLKSTAMPSSRLSKTLSKGIVA